MLILRALIAPTLIMILVPVSIWVIVYFRDRGDKKISSEEVIRTRSPKILSGIFLVFAIIMFLGGIATIIYSCINSEEIDIVIVITVFVIIAVFFGLGFFGYAYARFNYVVADKEGIMAYRLFRKKKYYRYEDISYFKFGIMGDLVGYNYYDKKIFSIDPLFIGVSLVAECLREHEVHER